MFGLVWLRLRECLMSATVMFAATSAIAALLVMIVSLVAIWAGPDRARRATVVLALLLRQGKSHGKVRRREVRPQSNHVKGGNR